MAANEFRVIAPRARLSTGRRWRPISNGPSPASWRSRHVWPSGPARPDSGSAPWPTPSTASVRIDNDASSNATVVEVRAPDSVGLLYRITKALAELGVDIRHAKIQTLGDGWSTRFYVRGAEGKVEDPFHLRRWSERCCTPSVSF